MYEYADTGEPATAVNVHFVTPVKSLRVILYINLDPSTRSLYIILWRRSLPSPLLYIIYAGTLEIVPSVPTSGEYVQNFGHPWPHRTSNGAP